MSIEFNYLNIQGWMISNLKLKGNYLLAYALIYGFCQDGKTLFSGSASYIAEWLNIDKRNVYPILQKLTSEGFILKHEKTVNGIKLCDYSINFDKITGKNQNTDTENKTSPPVMKHHGGSDETSPGVVMKHHGGSDETSHHIYIDNNIDNNIDIENKTEKETEGSQNFSNIIGEYIKQNKDKLNDPNEMKNRIMEAFNKLAPSFKDRLSINLLLKQLNELFLNKRWASSKEINKAVSSSVILLTNDDMSHEVLIKETPNASDKRLSFFGYDLRRGETPQEYVKKILKAKKWYCARINVTNIADEVIYAE